MNVIELIVWYVTIMEILTTLMWYNSFDGWLVSHKIN